MKSLLHNKGIVYIIRFVVYFILLYGFSVFYIGLTSPAGATYNAFLDHHFNYINWWRTSILLVSNQLAHWFGLHSYVEHPFILKAWQGAGVRMVYSCIGYGVTSFWCAFVLANEEKWKIKLRWLVVGVVGIFIVNCFRVSILLLAIQNNWKVNRFADHHALFNIAAYVLIFTLIYFYTQKPRIFTPNIPLPGIKSQLPI